MYHIIHFTEDFMTSPKVSIIIPVFNTSEFVGECLESLLNQTLTDIEIICVDDGSTDDSLFILRKYAEVDKRIIVLTQQNKGAGVARNYGMSVAKGEYLSFLDSDDFFSHDMLSETVTAADRKQADIIVYRFEKYNHVTGEYTSAGYAFHNEWWPDKPFNYEANPDKIFNSFNPCTWNKLFRHSFVKENHLFFQDNKRTNDMFFTCTALACARRIFLVDRVFAYYRIGLLNNSQSTNTVAPWDFYKALLGIKTFLEERNLFSALHESYKTLAKNTCVYNINTNKEQSILLYEELKKERFEKLGIQVIPSDKISADFHKRYLEHIYFKHVDKAKEQYTADVLKKADLQFVPKVSVIVPVYNVENYIIDCLTSLSNQKLQEIEIICVNDGSTDNSLEIIKKYAETDSRVHILSQENRGLSEARNSGVKIASGEYLYFIDGDDLLDETALFELYTKAVDNDLDIVYFDADSFLDAKEDINDVVLQKKLQAYLEYYHRKDDYSEVISGTDMFVKMKANREYRSSACLQLIMRSFYEKNKLSFYPGILHEDNLFSLPAILLAKRTSHINKSYYKRRVHAGSIMTKTETVKNLYGYLIVYCEVQRFLDKHDFEVAVSEAIITEVNSVYIGSIARIYTVIPEEEKKLLQKRLTVYQKIQLQNCLRINQIKELQLKNKKQEQKNVKLNEDISKAKEQIKKLNEKIHTLDDILLKTQKDKDYLQKEKVDNEKRLQKEKTDIKTRLQKEKAEIEARLQKEKVDNEKRLQKEKADIETRLQKEKVDIETRLQKEKADIETRLQKEKADIKTRLQKEKDDCERKRAFYVRELKNVKSGYSFRTGRVITWLPRKIRGGYRCYQQHGLTYTAKRAIEHMGIDMGTGK